MDKINVAVLAGGNSAEREVSLKSCENLVDSLDKNRYNIHIYSLPSEGGGEWIKEIAGDMPDIAVSALHGGIGEDGSVQGLLRCIGIPYVGSGVFSSALCMDKKRTKTLLEANHIQTATDIFIRRGDNIDAFCDEAGEIGFPLVVKPNRGGSSIGIEIVNDFKGLKKAARNIFEKYNDDVIIEKFIKGREITCCVSERDNKPYVMAVLQVNKKGEIFDYEDKYERGISSAVSDMPEFMRDMVKTIAVRTFNLLKCRDYACVDMIVNEEQIYVIEVNTLPGLTKNSIVPMACQISGVSFGGFMESLIDRRLEKYCDKK